MLTNENAPMTLSALISALRATPQSQKADFVARSLTRLRHDLKAGNGAAKSEAVLKLAYLWLLGYEPTRRDSFSMVEVLSLPALHLKRRGYLACCTTFTSETPAALLTLNPIRKDLMSGDPMRVLLALNCAANVCTEDIARELHADVASLFNSGELTRIRSILCYARLTACYPEATAEGRRRLREICLNLITESDRHDGVIAALLTVFLEIAVSKPSKFTDLAPLAYAVLTKPATNWVLLKALRLLTVLCPVEPRLAPKLVPVIESLLQSPSLAKSVELELLTFVVTTLPASWPLAREALKRIVDSFIKSVDSNLTTLGLEMLAAATTKRDDDWRSLSMSVLGSSEDRALDELLKYVASRDEIALSASLAVLEATVTATTFKPAIAALRKLAGLDEGLSPNGYKYLEALLRLGSLLLLVGMMSNIRRHFIPFWLRLRSVFCDIVVTKFFLGKRDLSGGVCRRNYSLITNVPEYVALLIDIGRVARDASLLKTVKIQLETLLQTFPRYAHFISTALWAFLWPSGGAKDGERLAPHSLLISICQILSKRVSAILRPAEKPLVPLLLRLFRGIPGLQDAFEADNTYIFSTSCQKRCENLASSLGADFSLVKVATALLGIKLRALLEHQYSDVPKMAFSISMVPDNMGNSLSCVAEPVSHIAQMYNNLDKSIEVDVLARAAEFSLDRSPMSSEPSSVDPTSLESTSWYKRAKQRLIFKRNKSQRQRQPLLHGAETGMQKQKAWELVGSNSSLTLYGSVAQVYVAPGAAGSTKKENEFPQATIDLVFRAEAISTGGAGQTFKHCCITQVQLAKESSESTYTGRHANSFDPPQCFVEDFSRRSKRSKLLLTVSPDELDFHNGEDLVIAVEATYDEVHIAEGNISRTVTKHLSGTIRVPLRSFINPVAMTVDDFQEFLQLYPAAYTATAVSNYQYRIEDAGSTDRNVLLDQLRTMAKLSNLHFDSSAPAGEIASPKHVYGILTGRFIMVPASIPAAEPMHLIGGWINADFSNQRNGSKSATAESDNSETPSVFVTFTIKIVSAEDLLVKAAMHCIKRSLHDVFGGQHV